MLDVIYVIAALALFALVAAVARAVEKTNPRSSGSVHREVTGGAGRG